MLAPALTPAPGLCFRAQPLWLRSPQAGPRFRPSRGGDAGSEGGAALGLAGWHSVWGPWGHTRLPCPRGHLRAFVLGSQLQTIMSHPYLLTVHDFEQEGSEELDTVILKALVKGEARPCLRRALGRGGWPTSPARGGPHPRDSASRACAWGAALCCECECLSVWSAVCTQRQHV